jgi:hypothetical protein
MLDGVELLNLLASGACFRLTCALFSMGETEFHGCCHIRHVVLASRPGHRRRDEAMVEIVFDVSPAIDIIGKNASRAFHSEELYSLTRHVASIRILRSPSLTPPVTLALIPSCACLISTQSDSGVNL